MPKRDYATSTFGKTLHLYANSASGDDGYNGLSDVKAKQTLNAVMALVPDVLHHSVMVHLSGTFTDEYADISCRRGGTGVYFVIDGGDEVLEWDQNTQTFVTSGTLYTATDTETDNTMIGDSVGATFPNDGLYGYWIKIISGANGTTGNIRTIQRNTTNTLYPTRYFSGDPGAGATFKIVKPKTTLNGAVSNCGFNIQSTVTTFIQRIFITGTKGRLYMDGFGSRLFLMSLVSDSSYGGVLNFRNCGLVRLADGITTGVDPYTSVAGPGVSLLGTPITNNAYFYNPNEVAIYGCVTKYLQIVNGGAFRIGNGSRFGCLELCRCGAAVGVTTTIFTLQSDAGYAPVRITGSTGSGLSLVDSTLDIGANVDISDNTEHGIDTMGSTLRMFSAVAGSGNGGAGLYAHSGSQVTIKDGSPPTLTGTVGNVAIIDPTYEDVTWSTIDGGESFHSAQEATIIKEVA